MNPYFTFPPSIAIGHGRELREQAAAARHGRQLRRARRAARGNG